jgi:hypothetical protein
VKNYTNIIVFFLISACGTQPATTGKVAMKVNTTDAHIFMAGPELKVGDKVNIIRTICSRDLYHANRNSAVPICKKEKMGEGIVTTLLNDHYSVVKFDQGADFRAGTVIERQ